MIADMLTLGTTFMLQLRNDDGSWSFVDQTKYTDRDDCERQAAEMYGGWFKANHAYRIVRIERHIEEA